jgi:glycosyltransferase involved in cell wall biosynthesis
MRKNILVCAYAISPLRGSEFSVAWNYINEMSKDNNLIVLYGSAGNHMGDFVELDNWMLVNSIPNVKFYPVFPNQIAVKLNYLNRKGVLPYIFYLAYNIWHRQVYKTAKKIIENDQIDLIHFLNPIGYREPGFLWKFNIPYIWGPIGGVPNRPKHLFNDLTFKNKIFFTVRNWTNTFQFKYNRRLKKALNSADLLLTATTENQILIEEEYNKKSIYLPENAIIESEFNRRVIEIVSGEVCEIAWIGSIDSRKSLNFLIEALREVKSQNWHLNIIGEGSLKTSMQLLAKKSQINDKITWHGQIKRKEVYEILNSTHLHVITSLGEGNPTTIWEAMNRGIPTISLNHCGMKDVICEKCGVKIKIETVQQIKNDLAFVISDFIHNPTKINDLSKGVLECSMKFTWNKRRELFNEYYNLAIENWNHNQVNK